MKSSKTLAALTCTFALSNIGMNAGENPHQYQPIGAATEVRADLVQQKKIADSNSDNQKNGKAMVSDKPPEGKCGEGKCGDDNGDDDDNKSGEGKCGESKCGESKCGPNKPKKQNPPSKK